MRAAGHRVGDGGAIHGDAHRAVAGTCAQDIHIEQPVVLADTIGRDGHARLQHGQVQETAAVERQVLDFLARDHAPYSVTVIVDLSGFALHADHFGGCAHLHGQLDCGHPAHLHRGVIEQCPESRRFGFHAVTSREQGRHMERPVGGRHHLARPSRILVGHRYGGPLHQTARLVVRRAV